MVIFSAKRTTGLQEQKVDRMPWFNGWWYELDVWILRDFSRFKIQDKQMKLCFSLLLCL